MNREGFVGGFVMEERIDDAFREREMVGGNDTG